MYKIYIYGNVDIARRKGRAIPIRVRPKRRTSPRTTTFSTSQIARNQQNTARYAARRARYSEIFRGFSFCSDEDDAARAPRKRIPRERPARMKVPVLPSLIEALLCSRNVSRRDATAEQKVATSLYARGGRGEDQPSRAPRCNETARGISVSRMRNVALMRNLARHGTNILNTIRQIYQKYLAMSSNNIPRYLP